MTEFEILAEISIGLIGFAGVVVALGRSALSRSTRKFHLIMLFANGAAALWGSLSPTLARLILGLESPYISLACIMYLPVFIFVNIYAWRVLFRFFPGLRLARQFRLTLSFSFVRLHLSTCLLR